MKVNLLHTIAHHDPVIDNATGKPVMRTVKYRGIDTVVPAINNVYLPAGTSHDLPDDVADAAVLSGAAEYADADREAAVERTASRRRKSVVSDPALD
jgi:uncharacterized protein YjlB